MPLEKYMIPIGHSHTRLTSTISLFPMQDPRIYGVSPVPLAGPDYPLDWLDPIPRPLCRVHHPDLLQRLVLRMRASILDPVRIETEFGYRRVQLLQTTLVEFGSEGHLCYYAWGITQQRPCLTTVPTSFVSAVGLGHEGRWHSGFAVGLLAALRRLHHWLSPEWSLVPPYVMWVMDRVRSHLRDYIDMAPVHDVIGQALLSDPKAEGRPTVRMGLDPLVLAQAKTLAHYAADPASPYPTLKDYMECIPCLQNRD
jgi:hypothetical protein